MSLIIFPNPPPPFQTSNGAIKKLVEAEFIWYDQWLATGEKSIMDDIINYNEDDVRRATEHLSLWIKKTLR